MVHGTGGVFFCGTDVCCVVVGTVFSCRILGVEDVCGELGDSPSPIVTDMRGAFPLGDMRGANVDGVGQVSVKRSLSVLV